MELKYELTPTDLVEYQKESSKKGTSHVAQVLVFGAVIVLFTISDVVLSLFLTITPTTSLGLNLLARSTTGLVLLGVTYVVLMAIAKRQATKASVTLGPNGVFCEHTFAIDESGFTETTHVNKNFGVWAGVEGVEVTLSFVVVKVRLCCNYFIPRRAFANDEEIRTFVTTIRGYLSPGTAD